MKSLEWYGRSVCRQWTSTPDRRTRGGATPRVQTVSEMISVNVTRIVNLSQRLTPNKITVTPIQQDQANKIIVQKHLRTGEPPSSYLNNTVCNAFKLCHNITPLFMDLRWLPVRFRIELKLLLITYKIVHSLAPQYLSELVSVKSQSRYCLRSSGDGNHPVGCGKAALGNRAFEYKCTTPLEQTST